MLFMFVMILVQIIAVIFVFRSALSEGVGKGFIISSLVGIAAGLLAIIYSLVIGV